MNSLDTILDKLELKKAAPAPLKPAALASQSQAVAIDDGSDVADSIRSLKPAQSAQLSEAAEAAPISQVDVVKKLGQLAAGSGLDWKVSIVDLLNLLGMESSPEARSALATELACPAEMLKDSARMNVWLHKEVLKKIAENGGNIPQSLLD